MKSHSMILFILIPLLLSSCALRTPYTPEPQALQQGLLSNPNTRIRIKNLRPCTDSPDSTLNFNSNKPITVLVHGCNGSAGRFRSLAQLYAFHGQQAVCYSYDDRDSLVGSSIQLNTALSELTEHIENKELTIIGHSMGGLVARKAMESSLNESLYTNETNIKLVTVSAPLSGIQVASPCGNTLLQWLTLGIIPASCRAFSGENWYEITPQSSFIRYPSPLQPAVSQYLKIVTDERNACRRTNENGKCLETDDIFSLSEQYHPVIDDDTKVTNVEVKAGHVEIVGYKFVAPRKLLNILQQQNIIAPTPLARKKALDHLLATLY